MTTIPHIRLFGDAAASTYAVGAVPVWQDDVDVVHVFLSEINGMHCLAWEGTHTFWEWVVDFMAIEVPIFSHPQLGPVHLGMARDVMSVIRPISSTLESLGWPPYLNTGHSKGAGEALIFHGVMKALGHPPLATRAFEAPRIGSSIMRAYVADQDIIQTATHNYHGTDIVTKVVPGPTFTDMRDPMILTVPDSYDIPQKHEIPAVLAALPPLLAG